MGLTGMEGLGNTLSEVRLFSNYQQRVISRSYEAPLAILTSPLWDLTIGKS